jgi:hypothetical protein
MKPRLVNINSNVIYDVYIGRYPRAGFDYGNPIKRGERCFYCSQIHRDKGSTIDCFREYFLQRVNVDENYRKEILKLKNKTLGCFCRPGYCHGDVYLEWLEGQ